MFKFTKHRWIFLLITIFLITSGSICNPGPNLQDYVIMAAAGTGGSISPTGTVKVNNGADQTFTITADTGYSVSDIKVDGSSVGAVTTYTFTNVTADHTIEAVFSSTVPEIPSAPSFCYGVHFGDDLIAGQTYFHIVAATVNNATGYYLYESSDGNSFSRVLNATFESASGYNFVGVQINSATNKYYYVRAYNSRGEGDNSQTVYAEPSNFSDNGNFIVSPQQGQTGVSLNPTISFGGVLNANKFTVGVYIPNSSDVWDVIYENSTLSAIYGATSEGITTIRNAAPLVNNTVYGIGSEAINSNNWGFLRSSITFTTVQ